MVSNPIASYLELADRIDRFTQNVIQHHGSEIRCKPGCSDCCRVDLSIYVFEAEHILGAFEKLTSKQQESVLERARNLSRGRSGDCPFLEQNICLAYENRPIICRTHGLVLLVPGEDRISVCLHNFKSQTKLDKRFVMDLEPINQILATINHIKTGGFTRTTISRAIVDLKA